MTVPDAPFDLVAEPITDTQIYLTWSVSDNPTDRKVERLVAGVWAQIADVAGEGITSYSDTGLTAETLYRYRVRSCNGTDCSAYSNEATATTLAAGSENTVLDDFNRANEGPPPGPGWLDVDGMILADNMMVTPGSSGYFAVWNECKGPNCHVSADIARLPENNAAIGLAVLIQDPDSYDGYILVIDYEPITPSTIYLYAGTSEPENLLASLEITTPAVGDRWKIKRVATGNKVNVYRRLDGETAFELMLSVVNSTYQGTGYLGASIDISGPVGGEVGWDNFGGGGDTAVEPEAPSDLTATAVDHQSIAVLWADNSNNEDHFSLERSANGTTGWTEIAQVAANSNAYVDSGLAAEATWYYRVKAVNSCNESTYSNIDSATTDELVTPAVLNCDLTWGGDADAIGIEVAAGTAQIENTQASAIKVLDSGEAIVSGVSYVTQTLEGSGIINPLLGDRGAWDTTDYGARHARDIDNGVGLYHLPTPAGDGEAPVSSGGVYVATDIATQGELDTHEGLPDVHHAAVTLGVGSDAALALSGQELTLADVLTPDEHTAIGDSSPHHAAVTLDVDVDAVFSLSTQQFTLDTQAANLVWAGPATGVDAKPTFRSLVAADIPALSYAPVTHALLSTTHLDTTAAAVVRGDVVTGQGATPTWSRLAISVPAANVLNVLGVANGDTEPAWKTVLDATAPTTIGIGDVAAAGTALVFAHRDHTHGSPATWTATAHNLLSAIHGDATAASVVRGDLVTGQGVTPTWSRLAKGTSGAVLTGDGTDVAWSGYYLSGTAGGTTSLAVTSGKTLTLTATDNFNLTIPATGTVPLGTGASNRLSYWTGTNTLSGIISTNGYLYFDNEIGFGYSSTALPTAHGFLNSTYHSDTASGAVVRGDMIVGNSTPKWTRLGVGSANAFLRTDGTDIAWSTGFLAITATKTLTISNSLILAGTDNATLTLTTSLTNQGAAGVLAWSGATILTIPNVSGTAALGAGTLTATTTNDVTSATHTHAITSASNATVASILASDASGGLQLKYLGVGAAYDATQYPVLTSAIYTDITTAGKYGALFQATLARTANGGTYATSVLGFGALVQYGNSYTANDLLYGFQGRVSNSGTGGLYFAIGLNAQILNSSTGYIIYTRAVDVSVSVAAGGQIVDFDGIYIARGGAGTLTTARALHIQTTFTATTAWAIYNEATGAHSWHAGNVAIGGAARSTYLFDATLNNVTTAAIDTVAVVGHNSTGTPAAGFGMKQLFTLETSTTADQSAADLSVSWVVATHASRTARAVLSVYDTAAREIMRGEASGTLPMLGFYGGAAVVRGAALTTQLTTITHTAPGTPNYALQDLVQNTGFGFATKDEGNSLLAVVLNLQTRVAELEARLGSASGVNLFA